MTLIITVANGRRVIQVSDRRLTALRPGGGTVVGPEDKNKSLVANCANAHFCLSITGLAEIRGRPMILWLADRLLRSNVLLGPFDGVENFLMRDLLPEVSAASPKDAQGRVLPTLFVVAGYEPVHTRWRVFTTYYSTTSIRCREFGGNRGYCSFCGTIDSVPDSLMNRLVLLVHSSLFTKRDQTLAVNELVSMIRTASDHADYGKFIGKNCSSLVLASDWTRLIVGDHPLVGRARAIPPVMIVNNVIVRTTLESNTAKPFDGGGVLDLKIG